MNQNSLWADLQEACMNLDQDSVLVTPSSEEAFTVNAVKEDRIIIEFIDSGEERTLWHSQFEILFDQLESESNGFAIHNLPTGVEPYVSVVSLMPEFVVDQQANQIKASTSGKKNQSPFLQPEWTTRTPSERVHDDALLLADTIERLDISRPESLSAEELVDIYVLLSDVQHGSNRLRKSIGDVLLEHIGPAGKLHGRYGTVQRTTREQRHLKDKDTILDALDEEGIPHEWVLGIDREKLDVVLSVTDLEEKDVYDIDEQVYAQKTSVEEEEKQTHLQGLEDRLAALETEDAAELRNEIEDLEERLD
ncbi:MAG: hypothetical protein ABEI06_04560, partial [Halobacteriaceae archaeon]